MRTMNAMDIDNDLDASLLQQFSCLGTTDRDVLVSQLQKLLGNQLNASDCAFFLDMNNWNLQAALCSYFDFETSKEPDLSMIFLKDETVGEGEAVPPKTKFIKTWRIQNSGDKRWPPGCSLKMTSGEEMCQHQRIMVEALAPKETASVTVEMVSPSQAGIYHSQWRMATPTGQLFGEVIWVIVTVDEGGLLAVTQQMEAFHHLGSIGALPVVDTNPFAPSHGHKYGMCQTPTEAISIPQTVSTVTEEFDHSGDNTHTSDHQSSSPLNFSSSPRDSSNQQIRYGSSAPWSWRPTSTDDRST